MGNTVISEPNVYRLELPGMDGHSHLDILDSAPPLGSIAWIPILRNLDDMLTGEEGLWTVALPMGWVDTLRLPCSDAELFTSISSRIVGEGEAVLELSEPPAVIKHSSVPTRGPIRGNWISMTNSHEASFPFEWEFQRSEDEIVASEPSYVRLNLSSWRL